MQQTHSFILETKALPMCQFTFVIVNALLEKKAKDKNDFGKWLFSMGASKKYGQTFGHKIYVYI